MSLVHAAIANTTARLDAPRAVALYHICLAVQAASNLQAVADNTYEAAAEATAALLVDHIALAANALGISSELVRAMADAVSAERGTIWRPPAR